MCVIVRWQPSELLTGVCDDSRVSFDLYVFDMHDVPHGDEAIGTLLEDDTAWNAPLTPTLAEFVAELEAEFPGLDDDPDNSPWASWPLTQSMVHGNCCAFNIVWSSAEAMSAEITSSATARGLKVYDPQSGSVVGIAPQGVPDGRARRKWWRRG